MLPDYRGTAVQGAGRGIDCLDGERSAPHPPGSIEAPNLEVRIALGIGVYGKAGKSGADSAGTSDEPALWGRSGVHWPKTRLFYQNSSCLTLALLLRGLNRLFRLLWFWSRLLSHLRSWLWFCARDRFGCSSGGFGFVVEHRWFPFIDWPGV